MARKTRSLAIVLADSTANEYAGYLFMMETSDFGYNVSYHHQETVLSYRKGVATTGSGKAYRVYADWSVKQL